MPGPSMGPSADETLDASLGGAPGGPTRERKAEDVELVIEQVEDHVDEFEREGGDITARACDNGLSDIARPDQRTLT